MAIYNPRNYSFLLSVTFLKEKLVDIDPIFSISIIHKTAIFNCCMPSLKNLNVEANNKVLNFSVKTTVKNLFYEWRRWKRRNRYLPVSHLKKQRTMLFSRIINDQETLKKFQRHTISENVFFKLAEKCKYSISQHCSVKFTTK